MRRSERLTGEERHTASTTQTETPPSGGVSVLYIPTADDVNAAYIRLMRLGMPPGEAEDAARHLVEVALRKRISPRPGGDHIRDWMYGAARYQFLQWNSRRSKEARALREYSLGVDPMTGEEVPTQLRPLSAEEERLSKRRAAKAASKERKRLGLPRRPPGPPRQDIQHGTSNGYGHHGCRCPECRSWSKSYRDARRKKGQTQVRMMLHPLADPDPGIPFEAQDSTDLPDEIVMGGLTFHYIGTQDDVRHYAEKADG